MMRSKITSTDSKFDQQVNTVYNMVAYILKMCEMNSTTWSNHVQLLCIKYNLPSPLSLLQDRFKTVSKLDWNTLFRTRVTVWHEWQLRELSVINSKMKYFNVLSGRLHVVLPNIFTTQDVKKLRLLLKFLTCDFLCNETLFH